MTIKGLGTDIIEISRVSKAIERHPHSFVKRLFTDAEQSYCERYKDSGRHYAGRFAAKEAILKALGTGIIEGVSWLDIEISNNDHGKPEVILSSRLNEKFSSPRITLSISHCHEYATAVAIWSS